MGGSVECAQMLLDINSDLANAKDKRNNTPLFIAVLGRNVECVSLLLKQGAHLTTRSGDGHTALQAAKFHNVEECVKILSLAELVQKSIKKECLQKLWQTN